MCFLFLYNFDGTWCAVKIKELLRNFFVLQFADLKSINKELLELGLEVGSL